MVCTQFPKAPTAARSSVGAIGGGFILLPVACLVTAWRACRDKPLGLGDFRTWLAAHEMVARRCRQTSQPDRATSLASYSAAELTRLTGVTVKRARASIRRLAAAGLIAWSEESIEFLEPIEPPDQPSPSPLPPSGLSDTIGGGRGSIAIPRRLLRFLANGAGLALIATALAVLLRCLSRRKAGWEGRGRFKASWVAQAFGVSERRVKAARHELIALGWIEPEPSTGQRAENRWGRAYRINLAWVAPSSIQRPSPRGPSSTPARPADRPSQGPPKSPLHPSGRPVSVTPSVNQAPLPGVEKNQEPARGPSGFSIKGSGIGDKTLPSPTLAEVRIEDLKDIGRLLDLLSQAIDRKLIGSSEADRLKFVAAAEHALAIGQGNPPGLFAYFLRGACWRYITQGDEDRANARIKAFLRAPEPFPVAKASPSRPALSEDARALGEFRRAIASAGYRGDPFPQVRRHDPSWTRERWDAALVELDVTR
jgi:hypothetical protein